MPLRILIVAGDHSGDAHAAELALELRRRRPDIMLYGYGGAAMRDAEIELSFDLPALSAIGLWEVLPKILPARAAHRRLCAAVAAEPPDAAVLVDCGAFNLPLGRRLKELGVPVLGYFPPGSWSGSARRAAAVMAAYDAVATPFAQALPAYGAAGFRAEHVGHPAVEAIRERWPDGASRAEPPTLALLPGSRPPEVRYMLPAMLAAARLARAELPELRVRVSRAASQPAARLERLIARSGLPAEVVAGRAALDGATAALVKSGTITLEAAAMRVPLVCLYRGSLATGLVAALYYWPRPKYWAMPNVLAQAPIVPQLVQWQANPRQLAAEVLPLLRDTPARRAMLEALDQVTAPLAGRSAVARTADLLDELLSRGSPAPA